MANHKAAKDYASTDHEEATHCPECNLAAAYLELRELAKEFHAAMTALYPTSEEGRYMQDRWAKRRQKTGEALRAAIGEK